MTIMLIGTYQLQRLQFMESSYLNNSMQLRTYYSEPQPALSGLLLVLVPQEDDFLRNNTQYFVVVHTNIGSEYEYFLESIVLGRYELLLYSLSATRLLPSYEPVLTGAVNITRGKYQVSQSSLSYYNVRYYFCRNSVIM